MNISNSLRYLFCFSLFLPSSFLSAQADVQTQNTADSAVDFSKIPQEQMTEIQKMMAQAVDFFVTQNIEQTEQIEGLLEELAQAINNDVYDTKNKDELLKEIRELRKIIQTIRTGAFVQVDAQTLQQLVVFNELLMEHICEALKNKLENFSGFEKKLALLAKKSAAVSVEKIEEKINENKEQLEQLKYDVNSYGISWHNKMFRKLNNWTTIAHRRNWDWYAFLGTSVAALGIHALQDDRFEDLGLTVGYTKFEKDLRDAIKAKYDNSVTNGVFYEDQIKPLEIKFLKDYIELLPEGFSSRETLAAAIQAARNNGGWYFGKYFRRWLGFPLMRNKNGELVAGKYANAWNDLMVNKFGKAAPAFRATYLGLAASYLGVTQFLYKKGWATRLTFWTRKKISILHAKLLGGVAGKQAQEAQKSRIERWEPKYTFEDVVGFGHIKETLNVVLDYTKNPERFDRAGIPPERGYLFTGLPGTGKSFVAEAFGGEIRKVFKAIGRKEDELGFYTLDAEYILRNGITELLDFAKREAPCILFIDEIDLLGLQRGGKGNNALLSDFLSAMSGVLSKEAGKQVILIAATNKPEHLDRALRRRGRFGKIINFELPTLSERRLYFVKQLEPLLPDLSVIDVDKLAEETEGCTYQELAAMKNAAFQKSKISGTPITQTHLEKSLDEEIRNVINKEMHISEAEQKLIAAHQAGHAIALELLQTRRKLSAVTIKPVTADLQDEGLKHFEKRKQKDIVYGKVFTRCPFDHLNVLTQEETIKECKVILSGMAAEKIILGACGHCYHTQDKQNALELVKKLVFQGLSIKTMPNELQIRYFDQALEQLEQYEIEIEQLLREHEDALVQVAEELKEHKTLSAARIKEILKEK